MTAIDVLKNEKECVLRNITGCDRNCANCDLVLPDSYIIEAYDDAISALEKQIPKKPTQDDCLEHIFYCPTCTRWFNGYHKPHHCECGQALDWSEV